MALLILISPSVFAMRSEIPPMYYVIAEEHRIPAKLFYALILNESKSRVSNNKVLPWPWTINHRGKPYYFQTKVDAYRFIKTLIEQGDRQFDVGLGQLNWRWHENSFSGAWDALDPYINLTAAAKYLRKQFDRQECHEWVLAIGCYHRPSQKKRDKQIARNYAKKVIRIWKKL